MLLVVEWLLLGKVLVEEFRVLLQILVAESGAQLTHRLEFLRVHIVARQQEGSKRSRSLSLSIISSDGNEVQRVSQVLQVVLLQLPVKSPSNAHLQPVERSLRWLVGGVVHQRFHHQTLTSVRHRLHQKRLHLLRIVELPITLSQNAHFHVGCKLHATRDFVDVFAKHLSPLLQRLLQQRLPVEVDAVEHEDDDVDLDVLGFHVLLS